MKISFKAKGSNLIAAPDGAVATFKIGGASELAGIVVNHTSADGFTVATFATPVDGQRMPVIEMTRDNPALVFEVIAPSVDEFYATSNRDKHFNFYKELCERNGWVFNASAAINAAYWLSGNFDEISDSNVEEAAEIAKACHNQFAVYVKTVRIGPEPKRA